MNPIKIYTDGACSGNPGPGGASAVILKDGKRTEISEGYYLTTNNRMELRGVILGLQKADDADRIIIFSDSKYVVDAVNKGWLDNWLKNGWRLASKKPVKNTDLWLKIARFLEEKNIEFKWVEGHAGNPENERCDYLAQRAAANPSKQDDGFKEAFNPLGI